MFRAITLTLTLFHSIAFLAQYTISGRITDETTAPLAGAIIKLEESFLHAVSDEEGYYQLSGIEAGSYSLSVTFVGYKDFVQDVTFLTDNISVSTQMEVEALSSPAVIVRATRASHRDPMAYAELDKVELVKRNLGMDMPELLNTMPSVYFTSDAGNGIGYTYMRLRGSDQTNINVTINGVPLNDAESQGVFWVNLPDLSASAENIQVQRGVGTSSNGVGAFGGSVNVLTQTSSSEPYARLHAGYGSFNSQKYAIGFGTGLLDGIWSLDGRLSKISSDGYMDRSGAELQSYFLSAGFDKKKTSFKALIFGGSEVTQQAWWGVPRARLEGDEEGMMAFAVDNGWSDANTQNLLQSDRRFNYYRYEREVDDYGQDHAQLHFSHKADREWRFNASAHYTKGKGYFEQFQDSENAYDDTDFSYYGIDYPIIGNDTITSADFVRRRWLDNDFYGVIASAQYEKGPIRTILGAGWNRYDGDHFGEVIWASIAGDSEINDRYYDNTAIKEDLNFYIKTNYRFADHWDAYVDLQSRAIDYGFLGPSPEGELIDQEVDYQFFNPKAGLSYSPNDRHRAFASYAIAHKEPNRDDHVSSSIDSRPGAQRLADLELGYTYRSQKLAAEIVLYNMMYEDQLINTGEINDVGENVRTNVPNSYRRGIELLINARPLQRLIWSFNATLSKNIIEDHIEYVSDYFDYSLVEQRLGDVSIAYSPEMIASNVFTFSILDDKDERESISLDLSLITKYVSDQYLDNTETSSRIIDSFLTNDVRIDVLLHPRSFRSLRLTFLVRNLLDEQYESNGWTYRYLYDGVETSFDALFPQAGVNFMTGLTLDF